SMRTRWSDEGQTKQVTAPVSLIVSAFASIQDVRQTLTPQLITTENNQALDTTLILVDLGQGRNRLAGSILSQVLGQVGNDVPDLEEPTQLKQLVEPVNALRAQGKLLAYHDRADGGLWASICEMAFAGHTGVSLNVDMLITEGDGISDSRAEMGDSKNWASQVSERRKELTLKALFSEELGVVLQVRATDRDAVLQTLRAHGLSRHSHVIGKPNAKGIVEVYRDTKAVISAPLEQLHKVWDEVSSRIAQLRDSPACADSEHAAVGAPNDPG